MNEQTPDPRASWEEFYRDRAGVSSELIGAGNYFDAHPEAATDAALAKTFREYLARFREIEPPS